MGTPPNPAEAELSAYDKVDDFSGIDPSDCPNPYDALIVASNDDPKKIQAHYSAHREARNAAQREKFLSPSFAGVMVDTILQRLLDPTIEPGFVDTRNSLLFLTAPPQSVKALAKQIQAKLRDVVPNLYLMPPSTLHLTALEVAHSRPASDIAALTAALGPSAIRTIVSLTSSPHHRARLVKPLLGFDASALALSYVPADHDNAYTYHHLRRDLFAAVAAAGVRVESRYVVPSAHLTLARFVDADDFRAADRQVDAARVRALVDRVDEVNAWLRDEFWPKPSSLDQEGGGGAIRPGGEWVVGEEGMECRSGAAWYGSGGKTEMMGQGF